MSKLLNAIGRAAGAVGLAFLEAALKNKTGVDVTTTLGGIDVSVGAPTPQEGVRS